jgi:hypothetical protein
VRKQSADVVDADVAFELFTWLAAFLEEVGAEPNLFKVCFVRVLGQNLLDGNFPLRRTVNAKPHNAEPASSEKSHSLEVLREAFSEFIELISGEIGSNIEARLVSVSLIDFDCFFLGALGGADVVVSFVDAAEFVFAFRILLFFPIKNMF